MPRYLLELFGRVELFLLCARKQMRLDHQGTWHFSLLTEFDPFPWALPLLPGIFFFSPAEYLLSPVAVSHQMHLGRWHAGVYVGLGGSKLPGVLPEWREEPRLSSVDVALFSEVPRLSVEAKWPF